MSQVFNANILYPLIKNINRLPHNKAFCIGNVFYTYQEFGEHISKIRQEIIKLGENVIFFGLVVNDDIETYASIFALWLEGKAYVPLHPKNPLERNIEIVTQMDISSIIDSSDVSRYKNYRLIQTRTLSYRNGFLNLFDNLNDESIAYVLFTSGSTGKPKGVPISRGNLAGFINAFWELGIELDENDRCLQMFELTFDLSVMSYLVPLLKGACVYTIPIDKIKYSFLYELMEDEKLTFSLMVPSILNYLRSYFDEMHFPDMKYSLFCGEALPLDIAEEWSRVLPNAKIMNVYGPTEDTIFCTSYTFNINGNNKAYNGVLSVGKEMLGTRIITVNPNNTIAPPNSKGELCLSGVQLTSGYWKNETKNKEAFFVADFNGVRTRFYKTGDICVIDEEKDIFFIGRLDSQIQVQGFRVELSEIEYYVRKYLDKKNIVVIAFTNQLGNTEVGLLIEGDEFSEKDLISYLRIKLPRYMIPSSVKFKVKFPLNTSGKVDRNKLKREFIC